MRRPLCVGPSICLSNSSFLLVMVRVQEVRVAAKLPVIGDQDWPKHRQAAQWVGSCRALARPALEQSDRTVPRIVA
jgi:hypothetical protein